MVNEKSIKVDAATDRTVSELAYFLRTTKKAVVAIAVAEYSEQRDRYLTATTASGGGGDGEFGPQDAGGERGAPGDHGTGGGARASARESARPTVLDLAPLQRLALRRNELVRAFATQGAGDIRLLDTEPAGPGEAGLVLLAETDIAEGGQAAWDLSRVASRLLGLRVEVISTTMLRLFDKPRLRRALEQSRPL